MPAKSVFDSGDNQVVYDTSIEVEKLGGSMPADDQVRAKWIRTIFEGGHAAIAREVANRALEADVDQDAAMEDVIAQAGLNVFRREGDLRFIPAWCVRAMILETANILWPAKKWTARGKMTRAFWPEHVLVAPNKLFLPAEVANVSTPLPTELRFVHGVGKTGPYSAPAYDQFVEDVAFDFEVRVSKEADAVISDDAWAQLWTHAESFTGLGPNRKAQWGRFVVTRWDRRK